MPQHILINLADTIKNGLTFITLSLKKTQGVIWVVILFNVGDLVGDFELVSDYMFYFLNCLYFALYSGSLVKLEDVVEELLEDSLYFLFLCDEVLDLEFVVT